MKLISAYKIWFFVALTSVLPSIAEANPTSVQAVRSTQSAKPVAGFQRARMERLLSTLDRIAGLTAQMRPETSQRIEPVIVDLAEQTLSLAGLDRPTDAVRNVKAVNIDAELDRLENTVKELVGAMNRQLEPEISL